MSITDVMSQLSALQQLAGQLATPPSPVSGPGSFAAALDSASSGSSSAPAAADSADAGSASTGTADGSPTGVTATALISSLLQQSQAQALIGTLDSDSSDDSGGLDLSSLASLEQLLPTAAAAGASTAAPAALSTAPSATATAAFDPTGTGAQRLLAAAESQIGVSEQPPGSNNGPQISTYRSAVAGAEPGEPWCAYFASWAAAQGGVPLGESGQGFGSVAQITSWAASNGRLLPASATPAPGDLILFGDQHVGIVESVNPDGSLTTVEGNYNNAVTQVHRLPGEATGYVQM